MNRDCPDRNCPWCAIDEYDRDPELHTPEALARILRMRPQSLYLRTLVSKRRKALVDETVERFYGS